MLMPFGLGDPKFGSTMIRWPVQLPAEIRGQNGANLNFLPSPIKRISPNFDLNSPKIPQLPVYLPSPFGYPPFPLFSPPKFQSTPSKATEQLQKPKTRIFRPWDDHPTEKNTAPAPETKTVPTGSRNSAVETVQDQQQSALEVIATNLGKSAGGHRCIYCGKIYSRKYGLKIHLRTHTGFKPLKCKVCHRAFGDPSNLNKHTRLHAENGVAFKCHLCGKLLIRKRDLDRHLASRHTSTDAGNRHDFIPSVFDSEDIDGQTIISDSDSEEQISVDI